MPLLAPHFLDLLLTYGEILNRMRYQVLNSIALFSHCSQIALFYVMINIHFVSVSRESEQDLMGNIMSQINTVIGPGVCQGCSNSI